MAVVYRQGEYKGFSTRGNSRAVPPVAVEGLYQQGEYKACTTTRGEQQGCKTALGLKDLEGPNKTQGADQGSTRGALLGWQP